jgi:AmmeMemoRadiSam system protein B
MFEVRQPAVAGKFYPGDPKVLDAQVRSFLPAAARAEPALAVIAPHAGYVYSGAVAGEAYARVVVPKTAVVLCPNHTGLGARRAVWPSGRWRIPGGDLAVDQPFAGRLVELGRLEPDADAHLHEHAAEVHLPFLRARNPSVAIVPVCLGALGSADCVDLGESLADAVRERSGEVLLVASTDMSHYVCADEARRLDRLALEKIEKIDPEGLFALVRDLDLSMCGFIPTTVVLAAARALGAKRAELVRYGHSGETSGDLDRVVGYAALVIRPA